MTNDLYISSNDLSHLSIYLSILSLIYIYLIPLSPCMDMYVYVLMYMDVYICTGMDMCTD